MDFHNAEKSNARIKFCLRRNKFFSHFIMSFKLFMHLQNVFLPGPTQLFYQYRWHLYES